jgi:hypothetical protein
MATKSAIRLTKLPHNVADCLQRAADCAIKAEKAVDPIARQSFIDLADKWRANCGNLPIHRAG